MEVGVGDMALKLDPIVVDVALAEKYLKDHRCDIKKNLLPEVNEQLIKLPIPKKFKVLAEKIKENSKLFCQLEYLENNVPIEVSEINIQLILKCFSLDCSKYVYKYLPRMYPIDFCKDTPLAKLGVGFRALNVICAERAAVCHLYRKLCLESGFDLCATYLCDHEERTTNIGVISERSDLDSAVDAFLTSSSNVSCFWRLHRIYVQESIYESFNELLDIKTTLKGTKGTENVELKGLCTDLFVYEEKYILIDYAGDVHAPQLEGKHAILVEAYRTNKELLSLVGQAGCVSLWASDVAEANELAYGIPASLVWINDFGNFDGPPEISTVLYSLADFSCKHMVPSSFCSRYNIWSTYSKDKRLSIIRDVLEKVKLNSEDTKVQEVSALLEKIDKLKFNSVDVVDNKICVTLDYPVGIHFEKDCDFEPIIHSLVIGNGVIGLIRSDLSKFPFYNELTRVGVPIMSGRDKIDNKESDKTKINIYYRRYRTRVVLTNFGTIFAN